MLLRQEDLSPRYLDAESRDEKIESKSNGDEDVNSSGDIDAGRDRA